MGQWFTKWTEWCDSDSGVWWDGGQALIQSGHITFLWGWTTELRPEDWATSNADNVGRCLWTWRGSNGEATWCKSRRSQELRSLAGGEKPRIVLQKPLEWISLWLLFFKLTYKVVASIIAFSYTCVLYTLLSLSPPCSVFPSHWFTSLKVTYPFRFHDTCVVFQLSSLTPCVRS